MSQAKLRGYIILLNANRITIDDVPEPYKSAIIELQKPTEPTEPTEPPVEQP